MPISKSGRDTVSVETFTITTHHVEVNLADLLAQYGSGDQVILLIRTPSGRSKRVSLNGQFLQQDEEARGY